MNIIFNFLTKLLFRTIANYFATSFVLNFGQYTTIRMLELLVEKLEAPEMLPNICYGFVEQLLPNILGRLYIDQYFKNKSLEDMRYLTSLLHESFSQLLNESEWMDSKTKEEAKDKLNAMKQNVAYPDWIMVDSELDRYYDSVHI